MKWWESIKVVTESMAGLTTGNLTVNLKYRLTKRDNAFNKRGVDWALEICLTKPERWFIAYIYASEPTEEEISKNLKLIHRSIHIYRDAVTLPGPKRIVKA